MQVPEQLRKHFEPLQDEFDLWLDGEICDDKTLIPHVERALTGKNAEQEAISLGDAFRASGECFDFENHIRSCLKSSLVI